jgi:hypothetical protein
VVNTERFDLATRSFSAMASRRAALSGVLAAALSASLFPFGSEEAGARRKKKKKKRQQNNDVCPPSQVCGAVCCQAGTVCAGGLCQSPGTCQAGDNLCAAIANCNGNANCGCLNHFTDGAVLCGTFELAGCDANCQSDADCAGFGSGAFCTRKTGEICCFNLIPINQGFCALPCPT